MAVSHIAIPYAKALFELAVERNVLEETLKDIKVIAELCANNKDFRMMLKSPLINTDKKKIIFTRIFGETLSQLTLNYLLIIIRKKRESIIHDIALVFIELYKDYHGILTTVLKTAVPVTDDVRQKILKIMKDQTSMKIELIEEVKEELIGGFILQWKDKMYDASIRHQIKRMHKGVARINLYVKAIEH
jgi:F-type H+-transporting ATPase subunit delta